MIKIESLDIIRQSFSNIADAIRRVTGRNKRYKVSELAGAIDDLSRMTLGNVVYDYNSDQIEINQTNLSIAMVHCDIIEEGDINGFFFMEFEASENCNVYLSFEDNGITELWSPVSFVATAGTNTISFPHEYLQRTLGIHNFVAKCYCSNGTLTVYPRDIFYSIDSTKLDDRLIDSDIEIMDLSIKQTGTDSSPSEIWIIGKDKEENIVVKSHSYDNMDGEWTLRYNFGSGIAAAIEFDGNWLLRDKENTYTLETDETPFVFIIETDGTLVVYQNADINNRKVLDTNVTQLSTVRGYKSINIKEQDQGLVCAYVKNDGTLWYMQYIYNTTTETYIWNTPLQLESYIDVTNVNIYRLNDYRLCFCIATQNLKYWLLTDRTYIGGSITPERADITFSQKGLFNLVNTVNTGTACVFENVHASQDLFYIDYTYPLRFTPEEEESSLSDLLTFTVNGSAVDIKDIYIEDDKLYIQTVEPVAWTRQSNAEIQLIINNKTQSLWICTASNNKMGLYIASETFNWVIEREITTINTNNIEEVANINFSSIGNISMPFIVTSNINVIEDPVIISYSDENSLIIQREIVTSNKNVADENANISFTALGSITMTQTGTSPI